MEQRYPEGETLGERIRRLRKERGWTQDELVARLGVSKGQLTLVEGGKTRSLRQDTAELYAQALGVSAYYILTGRERPGLDEYPTFEAWLRSRNSDIKSERVRQYLLESYQLGLELERKMDAERAEASEE